MITSLYRVLAKDFLFRLRGNRQRGVGTQRAFVKGRPILDFCVNQNYLMEEYGVKRKVEV